MKTVGQKQVFRADADWSARYGDICRVFMVQQPIILVTGDGLSIAAMLPHATCECHLIVQHLHIDMQDVGSLNSV